MKLDAIGMVLALRLLSLQLIAWQRNRSMLTQYHRLSNDQLHFEMTGEDDLS